MTLEGLGRELRRIERALDTLRDKFDEEIVAVQQSIDDLLGDDPEDEQGTFQAVQEEIKNGTGKDWELKKDPPHKAKAGAPQKRKYIPKKVRHVRNFKISDDDALAALASMSHQFDNKQFAKKLNCSTGTATHHLKKLESKGAVLFVSAGRPSNPARWEVSI